MSIRNTLTPLAVLGALSVTLPLAAQQPIPTASRSVPSDQVAYQDVGGPRLGTVWGDAAKGPHGSFLRLPKGFVSPAHLHSGDYYGVVVEGTVTNVEAGKPEVAMGPGSYYFQKGQADHVTKCLGATDCLIYISQSNGFDFIVSSKM
jgi:hypothetical protein